MSERGISSAVIRRLPRYYRYLGELLENNVVRISSKELSIRMILGLNTIQNMIIIGAGNLGQALANYDFDRIGFKVIGIFDANPRLEGLAVHGIEIKMVDELEEFIKTHEIHVATLTVPKKNARTIASQLEEWGIRAIWNFAPTDLHVSDDVCVKNVHLDESLMTLSYNFRNRGKEKYSYHSYMDD